nr:chondroitinase-AC [uncultured Pedobacter sp.]
MKKLLLTIFCTNCLFAMASLAQTISPFETIMNKVYQDVSEEKSNPDKSTKEYLATLKEDGSWADIDYKSTAITVWEPSVHLDRITNLLQAYTNKTSSLYNDKNLFGAIVKGLQFWYKTDAKSDNWWHNEISVPQKLGVLLIIANYGKSKLPDDLKTGLLERMKRGFPDKRTGANKTDIATHYFYRALLTEDVKLLSFSLDQLFEPVQLVDGEEGLQYDFSYLQHGPQLYISGYGEVFIAGVLKVANYVKGTPYALSKEKLALFSTFYKDTYLHTIRGYYGDFSVEGRGVSRVDRLKKSEKSNLEGFKKIEPEYSIVWDEAITRFSTVGKPDFGVKPYHQHFWKADYALHVRPDYTFSVRIASTRTKRTEMGNKEDLYGRYLPDGATNIQVSGPEYFNIMPIWEWDKIPGTTSRNYTEDRLMTVNWGETGYNDFSGGVSDGIYGATAYELKYDSVSAKKAWFFFDHEIVCLGAGINSNTKEEITTTVNQAWLNGNVILSNHRKIGKGEVINYNAKKQSWLYHANTGYYFPDGGSLSLSTQQQTGNWHKINNSFSKDEVSGDVFKFWLNHGTQPHDAKYAYMVLPAIKSEKAMESYDPQTVKILANTTTQQAVYQQKLKILQVVFYKSSQIEAENFSVSVDKPCILMLKEEKKQIFISDPLFKEKSITVIVKDKKTGKSKSMKVDLPVDAYLGSTKEVEL